ncbi:uncharacterized protein LOC135923094 [Gordionus sp. m RMFG-2023]|uniref:uncharacterized protein LOC135923094 n=1 Tax=Gordionus sp. m RMFG-2023 TaxID=3053472 RepID=UPI0031FD3B51
MNLANQIVTEGTIPEDWRRSIIIPVYMGKGDPLDCGSYRAIKLLEHAMKKVFDRVPSEVTRWALRKSGVEEWLVIAVMAMYVGAQTAVRTDYGVSDSFEVKVGLHQGSVLSPLLS